MLHLDRILPLLYQHKKFLLLFTLGITLAAALLVNVLPTEYKSVATISPVNIQLTDKARIFNPNIKDLYSFFGGGDDIERIESANDWTSIYRAIVVENNLVGYFKIQEPDSSLRIEKAVDILRKKLYAKPTEKGQLQIIAWAKEPDTALLWVNAFRSKINLRMLEGIQLQYNTTIQELRNSLQKLQQEFIALSAVRDSSEAENVIRETKIQSIRQLIANNITITGEWQQALAAIPDVLMVLDGPVADKSAVRPDKLVVITGAFLAALLFAMTWVIVYHRNNLQ
jgi:capsular polysaccharide biosynthesis protein